MTTLEPVIASDSDAIQSRPNGLKLDCFVAYAPRNDGAAASSHSPAASGFTHSNSGS
jgi:hypothetical protein